MCLLSLRLSLVLVQLIFLMLKALKFWEVITDCQTNYKRWLESLIRHFKEIIIPMHFQKSVMFSQDAEIEKRPIF